MADAQQALGCVNWKDEGKESRRRRSRTSGSNRVKASGAKNFHLFEVNEEENGCALPLLRKKERGPDSSAILLWLLSRWTGPA